MMPGALPNLADLPQIAKFRKVRSAILLHSAASKTSKPLHSSASKVFPLKMSKKEEKKSPLDFVTDEGVNNGSPNDQSFNRSSSSSPLLHAEDSVSNRLLDNLLQNNKVSNFLGDGSNLRLQQAQLERDKQLIYEHPLFPLMAHLLEKCEIATKSVESQSSASLHDELKLFLQRMQREKTTLFGEDKETNDLMILALQVLRIHLLELEKVQELSRDFCNRYITALKGKMQSENLVRNDLGGYESDDSGSGYGGGSSVVSSRSQPPVAHLQYIHATNDISGPGTFLMGPAPGSTQSWMMTADPAILQQQQQHHQHQQQQHVQLQQLQHLHHLRQQPQACSEDSARMVAAAASWELLCKSTVGNMSGHSDSELDHNNYELFAESSPSRSSEKCVSKLSSLPSHYANQHLVHHQLTELAMAKSLDHDPKKSQGSGGMEICPEILENLSSAFPCSEESDTPNHSPPTRI